MTGAPTKNPTRALRIVVTVAAAVVAGILLTTIVAPPGPDAYDYLDWARAICYGDPTALKSHTISPTGFPVKQWSHGVGLLAAPLVGVVGRFALKVVGLLAVLGTVWCFFRILLHAARGDRALALLLFAIALLGTHFGFYALVHGSESLSFLPLSALVLLLLSRPRPRVEDAFLVGCCGYLLVLVRLQLIIYCVPAFIWLVWSLWENPTEHRPRDQRQLWICLGAAAIPLLLALAQAGLVNRLISGSPLTSPYVFKGQGFASLNFYEPEVGAVLFHPWHGLLAYHPLYLLASGCFLALVVGAPSWKVRMIGLATVSVMILHLMIHASWYTWWLGTATFGMRGLSVWFILTVPALAPLLRSRFRAPALSAIVLFCLWSFLLLAQTATPPVYDQYFTVAALLRSQVGAAVTVLSRGAMFAVAAAVGATWLLWPERDPSRLGLRVAHNALFGLYAFYVVDLDVERIGQFFRAGWLLHSGWRLPFEWLLCVGAGVLVSLLTGALLKREDSTEFIDPARKPLVRTRAATWAAALVLFVSNALFASSLVRMGRRPILDTSRYKYRSTLQVEAIETSYQEYLLVPGFERRKQSLKRFVDELRRESRITRP